MDAWKYLIAKVGILATLQRFDPCFVAFREAYQELKARFLTRRFEWLPFGVDTEVFDAVPGEKTDFRLLDGSAIRAAASGHGSLLCEEESRVSIYPRKAGSFPIHYDLGKLVGSSNISWLRLRIWPSRREPVDTVLWLCAILRVFRLERGSLVSFPEAENMRGFFPWTPFSKSHQMDPISSQDGR